MWLTQKLDIIDNNNDDDDNVEDDPKKLEMMELPWEKLRKEDLKLEGETQILS